VSTVVAVVVLVVVVVVVVVVGVAKWRREERSQAVGGKVSCTRPCELKHFNYKTTASALSRQQCDFFRLTLLLPFPPHTFAPR
jgi:hypothetical protein